jgi:CDP-diglyceride synthetase
MARYWFRQKRFGFGAGLPKTWEGFVAIIGYIVVVAAIGGGLPQLFEDKALGTLMAITIIIVLTVPFLIVCETRTAGGWRWRWGDK